MNALLVLLLVGVAEPARVSQLQSYLPPIEDEELEAILSDTTAIWYTEREMPRAHQAGRSPRGEMVSRGFHRSETGLMNPNREFPWDKAGGILSQYRDTLDDFKVIRLPKTADGRPAPIVYYYNAREQITQWVFPTGTEVVEVLLLRRQGEWLVYEIRRRTKYRDGWEPAIYLPYESLGDIAEIIDRPLALKFSGKSRILSRHPNRFVAAVRFDVLPDLSPEEVRKVLRSPFRKMEDSWERTALGSSNIVPNRYVASLVGADEESCKRCHEDTLKHADNFELNRSWWHNVRGSDGIFSFHPMEPSSLATSPNSPKRPVLRRSLIESGYLMKYDPKVHPRTLYYRSFK